MILLSVPKILNLFNPEILSHPAIAGRDSRKSSAAINIPRGEGQEIDPKGMAILASKRRAEGSRGIHAHPGVRRLKRDENCIECADKIRRITRGHVVSGRLHRRFDPRSPSYPGGKKSRSSLD